MHINIVKRVKKGIFKDFILNIIASGIYTLATQILAYPYLSRIMSGNEYGLVLTLMGINNAVGVSLGNPLNNTRILLQPSYDKKNLKGDYNLIFLFCLIIDIIVTASVTSIILKKFNIIALGCTIVSSLILFRAYYSASYRIVINYKKNLYSSISGLFGYIFGMWITYLTNSWIFTFVFGELFACIYIFYTAKIVHDGFQITPMLKRTLKKYLLIMSAAILSTMMTYMDRFFIYPFLGADQVSVYNVASFLGKTAGIIMIPVSGVLLTYYAKDSKLTIIEFYKRMGLFFGVSLLFYIGIILVGIPVTGFLYPTIIGGATPYFGIANLATTIFILGNTIQPTLLRFCSSIWQPIIQGIYFLIYLLLGIYGMQQEGLMGFCYAVLIANIIKIVIMIVIATITLYNN